MRSTGVPTSSTWRERIATKDNLLLMDNNEHLIETMFHQMLISDAFKGFARCLPNHDDLKSEIWSLKVGWLEVVLKETHKSNQKIIGKAEMELGYIGVEAIAHEFFGDFRSKICWQKNLPFTLTDDRSSLEVIECRFTEIIIFTAIISPKS